MGIEFMFGMIIKFLEMNSDGCTTLYLMPLNYILKM